MCARVGGLAGVAVTYGVSELAASLKSPHLRELPMSLKILNE